MIILNSKEMKAADNFTIDKIGITQPVLMERAALASLNVLEDFFGRKNEGWNVLVAVGSGNNGGDALALSRLLCERKCRVEVWLVGTHVKEEQLSILEKYPVEIHRKEKPENRNYDLIIDGLLGIGMSRKVEGKFADAITVLNRTEGKKFSLDIPSGINADNGREEGVSFKADLTVSFGYGKPGLYLYPGKEQAGKVVVADIGIPQMAVPENVGGLLFDSDENILFPTRKKDSHKGDYGKILVIAGSKASPGAALLCAKAAYYAGGGMVKLLSVKENREPVISSMPEIMFCAMEDCLNRKTVLEKEFAWCDCMVIGPGLGREENAEKILQAAVEYSDKPLVLDADALNILSENAFLWEKIRKDAGSGRRIVLTPHPIEFSRLCGQAVSAIKDDRIKAIEEFCRDTGVILVQKDAATIVGVAKNGCFKYYINTSGNPGMATGGSGDVLAGMLAVGISGKNISDSDVFELCCKYVYLHGISGDLAAEEKGMEALTAGDLISYLPEGYKRMEKRYV